jgi:hypothetical protein
MWNDFVFDIQVIEKQRSINMEVQKHQSMNLQTPLPPQQDRVDLYRIMARNFPNGAVLLFDRDLRYTLADGIGLAEVGLFSEMVEGKTIWEVFPLTEGLIRSLTS